MSLLAPSSALAPSFTPLMLSRIADPAWANVPAWAAMIEGMTPERYRIEYLTGPIEAPAGVDPDELTVRQLAERPNRRQRPAADRAFEAYAELAERGVAGRAQRFLDALGDRGAD